MPTCLQGGDHRYPVAVGERTALVVEQASTARKNEFPKGAPRAPFIFSPKTGQARHKRRPNERGSENKAPFPFCLSRCDFAGGGKKVSGKQVI
jgi:hypothetical protein